MLENECLEIFLVSSFFQTLMDLRRKMNKAIPPNTRLSLPHDRWGTFRLRAGKNVWFKLLSFMLAIKFIELRKNVNVYAKFLVCIQIQNQWNQMTGDFWKHCFHFFLYLFFDCFQDLFIKYCSIRLYFRWWVFYCVTNVVGLRTYLYLHFIENHFRNLLTVRYAT